MKACITLNGNDIFGRSEARTHNEVRIPISPETLTRLKEWSRQYDRALLAKEPAMLLTIGSEIFAWMDNGGWASQWAHGSGDRILEIAMDDPVSDTATPLLDLPWEILTFQKDFLAADATQAYVVHRRIGSCGGPPPVSPEYRDLRAMFMAAAPEDQRELDFEAEEAAILAATDRLPMQLLVEESGCIKFLEERLSVEGPFEAVHLSCHGAVAPHNDPILLLETPEGKIDQIPPGKLSDALGQEKAPLVFLSACCTAECATDLNRREASPDAMESYVRALIKAGVANVIGWDGAVHDSDAIQFARTFYGKLAEFATVPYAAAAARRDLLQTYRRDLQKGQHWHLARVYTGRHGGGQLCRRGKEKRRLRKNIGYKEFLDKANSRVPVATAQQFVGRRRPAQKILGILQDNEKKGVLICGMGNLGKSSLAARIANRMTRHKSVVIYERYDSLAMFDQLLGSLPGTERLDWERRWREKIRANGAVLVNVVEELLTTPFDQEPILLIIDDLEQILDPPLPGQQKTTVKAGFRSSLAGILQAFKGAETESKVLLTSRYRFTLPDNQGKDLADILATIQLPPMAERERAKQWQAARRTAADNHRKPVDNEKKTKEERLANRMLAAAGGNPGLQEILCRPLLADEFKAAENALAAINRWKDSGRIPVEESVAREFFQRISFDVYRKALTDTERSQLRSATLFSENLPVPRPAVVAVGKAAGIRDPDAAIDRLLALGLLDDWQPITTVEQLAANPLARPLIEKKLNKEEQALLAAAAVKPLMDAWGFGDDFPHDKRAVEVARIALMFQCPVKMIETAAAAAGDYLFRQAHQAEAALSLLTAALEKIEAVNHQPAPDFFRLAAYCAEHLGKRTEQIRFLERGRDLAKNDPIAMARVTADHAVAAKDEDPEKALEALNGAATVFKQENSEALYAETMGHIADIMLDLGNADEALRILSKKVLPIFESLHKVRDIAVTRGKIADTLTDLGKIDEALGTFENELLPIFERLGDVRSTAVIKGRMADILTRKGKVDKALHILKEEVLPIFERLGDVREKAVTLGKIAGIMADLDDSQEALRIHNEERLPIAEISQDQEMIAHIRFESAKIRIERGGIEQGERSLIIRELEESLRINRCLQRADGIAHSLKLLQQVRIGAHDSDKVLADPSPEHSFLFL